MSQHKMFSHHLEKNESDESSTVASYTALRSGASRVSLVKSATMETAGPLLAREVDAPGLLAVRGKARLWPGGSHCTVSRFPIWFKFSRAMHMSHPAYAKQCERWAGIFLDT